MTTRHQLADRYAARLARAHRLHEARLAKTVAARVESLNEAIQKVADEIDALVYEDTDEPVFRDDQYEICGLIAERLDVSKRRWQLIHEGSIKKALSFEQTLKLLMKQVKFEQQRS